MALALIAIPLEIVRKKNLYFDETFQGWGVDDLEWSYRICKSGTPIILREDVRALHLPHARDPEANKKTETQNYHRFLAKWPSPDVELSHAFGDVCANSLYFEYMADRRKVLDTLEGTLGIVRGTASGRSILFVGVELNESHQILNPEITRQFDTCEAIETLPLVGMAIPYQDNEIDDCRILEPISRFSDKYANAVYKEVNRVVKIPILQNRRPPSILTKNAP